MNLPLRLVALAALAALPACSRCAARPAPDAGPGAPAATRGWLEGELPATALEGEPVRGGTLVVRAMSEPGGFNGLDDSFRDAWSWRMTNRTVVETLIELDPVSYEARPLLAERWAESPDHLTTTFTLRQGVTFHDGSPFGASDVVAVLDAVGNPKLATTSARAELADLAGWRALGDGSVELTWRRVSPLGFRALSRLPIYPAKALAGDFEKLPLARSPIGTGPYRFASWETGSAITLQRHEAYWGQKPYLDRVVFKVVKDHTVAAQLFERGEFDLMTSIQPQVWRAIEAPTAANAWAVAGYHRLKSVDNSFSYIAWNAERPLFQDARVRRALAMLYPAEQILRNVDLGLEVPTTCPYWLRGPYCDPAVKPIAYDPAGARSLLAEAGWKDGDGDGVLDHEGQPFRFTFLLQQNSIRLGKLAPLLQQELARQGIAMELEKVEWSVLSERLTRHDFDATSRLWTEFDVDQDLSEVFHSGQAKGGSNIASYSNLRVDAALEAARAEVDPARRVAHCREVHRLLYADQPYLFMTSRVSLDAAKKRVRGLRPSLVWYDLRRVWVSP
ncbi:MAG: ABC transporter substrate-binding protein [Myxococcaceae bacterium]